MSESRWTHNGEEQNMRAEIEESRSTRCKKTMASCAWYLPEVTGQGPCHRQGHAITATDETVYLFGGSTVTEDGLKVKFHNDLYKLEVGKSAVRWQEVKQEGSIPKSRDGHSMCAVGQRIYLYGGKNNLLANHCLPGLYVLDIVTDYWREVQTTGSAPATLGHTLSHVGHALYVIGGLQDSVATSDVWMLNLELYTWVPLRVSGPRPPPRCDHAAAVVDDKIYVSGGCGAVDVYYNDLFVLDTETLSWEMPQVKGMAPSARAGHTFVAHRKKDIYIFGGTTDTMMKEMAIFSDLCKLSLSRPRWKWPLFTGTSCERRYGHSAVIIHSQMYIIGGQGRTRQFNDIQALVLINPSDRQPAIASLLEPLEDTSCQNTKAPRVCQYLTDQQSDCSGLPGRYGDKRVNADSTGSPIEVELPHGDATYTQNIKDLQNIKTQTSMAIEKALSDLGERYTGLFRREQRLEVARARLQEERRTLEEVFSQQQQDLAELVSQQRQRLEDWMLARRAENDAERKSIADQKVELHAERRRVEEERADLKRRAEQLRCLARQLSHT